TKTIDTNCATGCNITVYSREDKIYRIVPRQNNEVNSDWMPDSHRLNYHWVDSEARLTDPLVKEGGSHRLSTWPVALSQAAEKLSAFDGAEIAVIASARMTNEELFLTNRLVRLLEAGHVDTVPRSGEADGYLISADRNPNTNGVKLVLGLDDSGSQLDAIREGIDQGRIKALVVLQENLVEDAGFSAELLGKLEFLLQSYPLANPTADIADIVLPGAAWAEKSGTMINVTGRLQRLNRAVDGPGQTLEPWEIIRDLVQVMGGGNGIYSVTDLFKQLAEEVSEFNGLTWGRVGELGIPLIETGETIPLLEKEKERVAMGLIVG
ncbi:MAG: molybdopterin-dependent oxidoreductase, partial [Verrucomicrobiota bacterium]